MAAANRYDLVILGAGSTAFAAALRAQELGKTAVMTEERMLGGTCLNRGCMPSKNLIEAARLVHDAAHPRYPGLSSTPLPFDFRALVEQKDEIIRLYRDKKDRSLVGSRFSVERGHASFVDPHTVDVDGKRLVGDKILIATGSRAELPPIEGLDAVPCLTSDLLASDEPMEMTERPRSLLVVGGGYVALELGQLFRRFGSAVTLVERGPALLAHGYEPEVGPALERVFADEGIEVLTRSVVHSVRREGADTVAEVEVDGRRRELRAERLLVATGRRPNTDSIALERAGVTLGERGEVRVDQHLRTSVPHIYAAGDVVGRQGGSQMATPVGSQDGGIAAHNALASEPPRSVGHRVIPRAIFTDPPLAVVGMAAAEALAAGHACWCNTVPMSLVPRAGAIRETTGFIKMVADANTEEVLGVTMLGRSAEEVIHEAAMGLRFHARIRDFVDLLHVYPTMAEALKTVAISRYEDPAKISGCAE